MYLKPIQYYIDEYDRQTVQLCRDREQHLKASFVGDSETKVAQIWGKLLFKLSMYFDVEMLAGERWENKKKAIDERMNRDRAKDTLFATAEPPEYINCLTCRSRMKLIGKELYEAAIEGPERILFFFECPNNCKPRRAFFDNGDEYRPEPPLCPKCNGAVTKKVTREDGEIIMTETCTACGHVEATRFDTKTAAVDPDPDFAKDYQRFCLTDEQGEMYLKRKSEQIAELQVSRHKERDKAEKRLLEEIAKIKKLNINEIEQLLKTGLEKEQYGRLHFNAPEIGKILVVPFTLQNFQENRSERDRIFGLRKLIQNLLAPTNWRLMTDGIYNQLGILSGRLRGYDQHYELADLVERNKKTKTKSDTYA